MGQVGTPTPHGTNLRGPRPVYPFAALNGPEPFIIGMSEYVINNKKNDKLKVFDSEPAKWKSWKNRMIDHLCGSTPKWKTIIESIELAPYSFHKALPMLHPIGKGENAFQVAEKLHTFLGNCISDTLYARRAQMECGKAETGNGFDFWRQLLLENEGNGALI